MKKSLVLSLVITIIFCILSISNLRFFNFLELKLLDVMFLKRGDLKPSANIIIAAIDEKSLKELGQWPWSRDKMASLVKNATDAGAKVVGFDVIFAEPDRAGKDSIFAQELKQTPGAILGFYFDKGKKVSNVSELESAADSGSFNVYPDSDGIVRRLTLQDSLALKAASKFSGFTPIEKKDAAGNLTHIIIGESAIPVDTEGRMIINYDGGYRAFQNVSVADIIANNILPNQFKNSIVIVGASAPGLSDIRATPMSVGDPGVAIHANVIDNIVSGKFLVRGSFSEILNIIGLVVLGALAFLILSRAKILTSIIFQIAMLVVIFAAGYASFLKGVWLPVIYFILESFGLFVGITLLRYFTEGREKRRIHDAFKFYLAPEVIEQMMEGGNRPKLGGEKRQITILFSDVRSFTTISEGLAPDKLVSLMNEYFTEMTAIIKSEGGLVDKFIGDAIMAFFGAPVSDPGQAAKACKVALLMQQKVAELEKVWIEKYSIPSFKIGVGVNTGIAYVGNMGSSDRFNYTAIGDAVNLASRLEGLTKQYGAKVIISSSTKELAGESFEMKSLGQVTVKGKTQATEIFEIS